jgi:hypothetical protein
VRQDVRSERFAGLDVVPPIGIDQRVDAGVRVLPDQVDGLGHRTDGAAILRPLRLRLHRLGGRGRIGAIEQEEL